MPFNDYLNQFSGSGAMIAPGEGGYNPVDDYLKQRTGLNQQYLQPDKKRSLAQALMAGAGAMVAPAPRGQYNPGTLDRLIGAGNAGMGTYYDDQRQQEQDQMRSLLGQAQLGRYGMEQQSYEDEMKNRQALMQRKNAILGRLYQPGGYEDTEQQMSVATPSPIEQMKPLQRAYLETEMLGGDPNLAPLLKTADGGGGSPGVRHNMALRLMEEDPTLSYADAVSLTGGLMQGTTYREGRVQPFPGALETKGAMKFEETLGGEQAKTATASELERQKKIGEGVIPEREKQNTGKQNVSKVLTEVTELYQNLQKTGGIVSTEREASENIIATTKASKFGQMVGRATGAKDQEWRDRINQIRPLLINYIRQASQMGARGLDSEKELEFYLQAATDPQRGFEVNMNAIKVLDNAYGLGIVGTDTLPPEAKSQLREGEKVYFDNGQTWTLQNGVPQRLQ